MAAVVEPAASGVGPNAGLSERKRRAMPAASSTATLAVGTRAHLQHDAAWTLPHLTIMNACIANVPQTTPVNLCRRERHGDQAGRRSRGTW